MIKTWHKWFIITFAVMFVSIFFVFDALFFNAKTDANFFVPIVPEEEIVTKEDANPPTEDVADPNNNNNNNNNQNSQQAQTIKNYTNGYECLNDAIDRLLKERYYVYSYASAGTSLGNTQNTKGTKYFNGNTYRAEHFAYSDSAFGRNWYERTISDDCQTYSFIRTYSLDKNLNYNLQNASHKTYQKEEVPCNYSQDKLLTLPIIPIKGTDILSKFDRDSNAKFYIITVVFNVNKLPENFIASLKKITGASSIQYTSLKSEYYISKTTGKIEKFIQTEKYEMTVGIKLDVTYVLKGHIKYYDSPYQNTF